MMNQVAIMGRLTHDPELRRTGSGVAVVSFSIACERDYGEKGNKETDFFDVVAWRAVAENVAKYFTKGRMAAIIGRLQQETWTDKEGNKRSTVKIVADNVYFADSKRTDAASNANGPGAAAPAAPNGYGPGAAVPGAPNGYGSGVAPGANAYGPTAAAPGAPNGYGPGVAPGANAYGSAAAAPGAPNGYGPGVAPGANAYGPAAANAYGPGAAAPAATNGFGNGAPGFQDFGSLDSGNAKLPF